MNDKEKIFKIIEDYRAKKPLSIARNEACDIAKSVIKGLDFKRRIVV